MLISGLAKGEEKFVSQKEVIWNEPWMNSMAKISWEKLLKSQDQTMKDHEVVAVTEVAIEVDLEAAVAVMIVHVVVIALIVHRTLFRLKIFQRDVIGHN